MIDKEELSSSYHNQEEHWVSVSDLMAGLMMVFLLLAVIFMVNIEADKDKIKEVVIIYDQLRKELYLDLQSEFENDLENWGAEIYKDLTIRFQEPKILFALGSSTLKQPFKELLSDFFPRYVAIITSEKYKKSITEIRLEGHTSSIWGKEASQEDAYFLNMELSQARTRSTLRYLLKQEKIAQSLEWLKKHMTANGLSSSKLIYDNGIEDKDSSQRVEFKIINDADSRIAKILELD